MEVVKDQDAPTNPAALAAGHVLLNEGFEFIGKVEKAFPKSNDLNVAIMQFETGLLWLRQAVYMEAYKGARADNMSGKHQL